jgi:hypothetical protein
MRFCLGTAIGIFWRRMTDSRATVPARPPVLSMAVGVMRIRHMRVEMPCEFVLVDVAMRPHRHQFMQVVVVAIVMGVRMLMFERFMSVLVSVRLRQV